MKAVEGTITGSIIFEPTPHRDDRGFFTRTFDADVALAAGMDPAALVQDSQSRSSRGVIRGLHMRTDGGEGKLVRCAAGAVVDIAGDLRPESPTYRLWMSVILDDVDHRSVWLPPGLAHGFQALSMTADVCYRIDRSYQPGFDAAVRYDDPELAIPWPLPVHGISERDRNAPSLAELESHLGEWFGVPA